MYKTYTYDDLLSFCSRRIKSPAVFMHFCAYIHVGVLIYLFWGFE